MHLAVLIAAVIRFNPTLDVPELEFDLAEVDLLDPDALPGGVPEPPPEPEPEPELADPTPPDPQETEQQRREAEEAAQKKREEAERAEAERAAAEAAAEKKAKRKAAREKKRKQRQNFASEGTNADQLGPPTSTFHLLLVPKKIRKLPYATVGFSLLEPWPDFDFLVRKGGMDPLNDVNHIVIASPNITNELDTFLAVDYKTSRKKIVKAIERAAAADGEVIEWVNDGGFLRGNPRPKDPTKKDLDKRWFVFHPDKKIAMFVREVFLDQILSGSDAPAGEEGSARAYVDNLTNVREFAAQQPLSGLQLKVGDIRNSISNLKLPFPTPNLLEVSVEAARAPIMVLKLEFVSVVEAKKFVIWYEETLGEMLKAFEFRFTVKPIYDQVKVSQEGAMVTLRNDFTQEQIEFVLGALVEMVNEATSSADRQREKRKANKGSNPSGD